MFGACGEKPDVLAALQPLVLESVRTRNLTPSQTHETCNPESKSRAPKTPACNSARSPEEAREVHLGRLDLRSGVTYKLWTRRLRGGGFGCGDAVKVSKCSSLQYMRCEDTFSEAL